MYESNISTPAMATAWFEAAEAGDKSYISSNVEKFQRSQNADGQTALIIAAKNGFVDLVRILRGKEC